MVRSDCFVVIWNLLFLGDRLGYFGEPNNPIFIGPGAKLALGFAFLFSLTTVLSEPFSRIVLKDGRKTREIRSFLFFLMLITGFMFTMLSLVIH